MSPSFISRLADWLFIAASMAASFSSRVPESEVTALISSSCACLPSAKPRLIAVSMRLSLSVSDLFALLMVSISFE